MQTTTTTTTAARTTTTATTSYASTIGDHACYSFEEIESFGPAASPLQFPRPIVRDGMRKQALILYPPMGGNEIGDDVPIYRVEKVFHRKEYDQATDPTILQSSSSNNNNNNNNFVAYKPLRCLQDAIYGQVWCCLVLKLHGVVDDNGLARSAGVPLGSSIWEVTSDRVAIKMMLWSRIWEGRGMRMEDAIKEISALQFLGNNNDNENDNEGNTSGCSNNNNNSATEPTEMELEEEENGGTGTTAAVADDAAAASYYNDTSFSSCISSSLDVFQDEKYLYSVMNYYRDGELFGNLVARTGDYEQVSEDTARFWFQQILQGLYHLQKKGICHRDISLENIMLDEDRCGLIDMGLALLVPYAASSDPDVQITTVDGRSNDSSSSINNKKNCSRSKKNEEGSNNSVAHDNDNDNGNNAVKGVQRRRRLIQPQGTCGKLYCMSPEIFNNVDPFDGFAVDLWAAAVILFILLTGDRPYKMPSMMDPGFRLLAFGNLREVLQQGSSSNSSRSSSMMEEEGENNNHDSHDSHHSHGATGGDSRGHSQNNERKKKNINLSDAAVDLLENMLQIDPRERLSLAQVMTHPWMKMSGEVIAPPSPPPPPVAYS